MKKRWILLVSLVLFQTILTGCASKTAQLPIECLAHNMLISKEDISAPIDRVMLSPVPDEPDNSASNTFGAGSGVATHQISFYRGMGEEAYQRIINNIPTLYGEDDLWEVPDVNFESQIADEYQISCVTRNFTGSSEVKCYYMARYQDYMVIFWMNIYPDFDIDDFASGMAAIDREVAECFAALEEATPEP